MLSSSRSLVTRSIKINKGLLCCRFYTDGSLGSQRPIGSGDSFTKREKVNEDYYVKQHEKELLKTLKKQLKEQRDKLDHMEDTLNKLHE
ncbi:similar to Saccharomyces cerevisiae YDL130W-A STF1 Protein involved in regulation of the mitochondrial F1F0-ATP synthase [Maudiozyma barnettii]|uniref:ATPase inhibitor, mitochondrial n=1 Tax=Maudiozyma barnettii TaxID=61262 RepID=A0A8H2ZFY8_9SACH|nr:uncharacterized protein KABA2_03S09922 [Kazachstania barnettii]CAB4253989.1 similar to Saccharomyces cerevisiae YDL130W-A STF1 Protein involved in regulation of the mitochondrial F1F0-ATP synthase [Kazachstania barnettii]CAD1781739.1 similar to Saccharomyces cerevisiae YDL130W-A STF1 Protein involved in regulation of the mitochondrial F1F0-ATP synthase [Kazachstania barnettii]